MQRPDPAPQRERNAALTKQRLLDAAEGEFAARGFAGARLREIALAAGVQPALIHHYFADKQGLYRAVLDRALLPTSTESWSLLESRHDLEGLLEGFVEMLLCWNAAHQNLLCILRHEALGGSTVFVDVCKERTLAVVEAVKLLLEERQKSGEIRADVPASEIILATLSMTAYPFSDAGICEVMLPGAVVRDERAIARRTRAIVAILLGGVRAI